MPEHLAEGSSEPALTPGKLRLYGMRFCPFDHRIHLVLLAKNLAHENVFINLHKKPDWFLKLVPSTKVPALLVDGELLYESLIIADFLDEKYPGKSLHHKDPLQKAKDRIVIENFSKATSLYYKLVMSFSNPSLETFEALVAELSLLDTELDHRGSTFFAGNAPGMVDYMIWPFFERFCSTSLLCGSRFQLPVANHKHLLLWIDQMKEDKIVKSYYLEPEIYAEYTRSYAQGSPNYNIHVPE